MRTITVEILHVPSLLVTQTNWQRGQEIFGVRNTGTAQMIGPRQVIYVTAGLTLRAGETNGRGNLNRKHVSN